MKFSAKVNLLKNPTSSMKAFATVIIDGLVEINGFRVIEGARGLFVACPSKPSNTPGPDGKPQYFDDVRFTDADEKGFSATKDQLQEVVLRAYEELVATNIRGTTASARTNEAAPTGRKPQIAKASW